jgi:prepilin signal peptidase PulO-like enzyme (type II secretory pathway)
MPMKGRLAPPDSPALPTAGPGARSVVVTAVGASLAALVLLRYGPTARGAVAASLAVLLVVLSAIDLERGVLPNAIVLPAIAVALPAQLLLSPGRWLEWTLAAVGAALLLLMPLLVGRAGVGMGDVKLAFLLGLVLGEGVMLAIIVASFAVLPAALVLLGRHGGTAMRMGVPFGPFLSLGAVVALLAS